MPARHWMQIAALASALGLTGTAIAHDTDRTTSTDERTSVSTYGADTPSSGAIVTPEDKAVGMGKGNERARNRNGDDDEAATSSDNTSNDAESSVNPGPSRDEELSDNPGRADSDDTSPRYITPASPGSMMDRDSASRLNEDGSAPPRTGSDVHPSDMGPGNVRGE